MAVITKITTQKNNTERFNIYIDQGAGEEYGFSVDQDVLLAWSLKKGMQIDVEELEQILSEDKVKKAYNLALSYLTFRMRSEKEVEDYLRRKEYEEVEISKVVAKLKEYSFLNDEAFARAFVNTKKSTAVKGPKLIEQELYNKGIKGRLAEEALNGYTYAEQLEHVNKWMEKQAKKTLKESERAYHQRVTRQLLAKGFSYEVIEEALRLSSSFVGDVQQWEAIVYQGEKAKRKFAHISGYEHRYKMKQWLYSKGFPIQLIEQYLDEETGKFS
ncbi:recombination regulator RecX [Alkalihalophilus pseudofirmus]|uniref:recombination regulator RecX n=1 Tax=Alkalihalobacterium alkalinitrilicum TaxID=427920 RepID=UPI00094C3750|nr:recombination regulator RecX [Alkalihalobacterium alkalinitrilicum]OLO28205.1 recombination regulator RecX [Alkalihalophilus pseudofirmus]